MFAFPLPLPTVPEQREMIDQLFAGHAAAKQKREEAAAARVKAWTDFEATVYGATAKDDMPHPTPLVSSSLEI